jgi:hypothetical protein
VFTQKAILPKIMTDIIFLGAGLFIKIKKSLFWNLNDVVFGSMVTKYIKLYGAKIMFKNGWMEELP